MQIAILGRQPKISLAELESLFGTEKISEIDSYAALVDTDEHLPQVRLGGTMKSAKLLTRLQKTDLTGAFVYLQKTIPDHLLQLPEGKLQFGVSCYGFDMKADWIVRKVLGLKKTIKNSGRSVRIIENKKPELESAQVLYNKLTSPLGWELLLIKDGNNVIVGQTTAVQNIDDYSKRDFDRPKRDSFVGMLPPKLAQIMINLASTRTEADEKSQTTIFDPFCGTGVVLQEALLMGYGILGSDISQKMVEYTRVNLDWLQEKYEMKNTNYEVEVADATSYKWPLENLQSSPTNLFIVCETYLGKPLSSLPADRELNGIMSEANDIAEKFLSNIAPQLKKGTHLCLALPAWRAESKTTNYQLPTTDFHHLKVLDHLTDLGYNRLDLKHATKSELIYHRPDQIVARELTILEKI